eukprot:CAMPEP_0194047366 /NCGR_PEP_ID=MMETSP0009_2-20130614/24217_1 /TAXON_ID=210454 /ORGANISM="Grammatophora oceanica, Strain CCMP 410" /LENGTH=66 /DNA_ID=CAMNT_0038692957 /DNA_START=27 /DNA_END=227 /DNA_ORIENTATION=+
MTTPTSFCGATPLVSDNKQQQHTTRKLLSSMKMKSCTYWMEEVAELWFGALRTEVVAKEHEDDDEN